MEEFEYPSQKFQKNKNSEIALGACGNTTGRVSVPRRQGSERARLFCGERLLWVKLYRFWPQALNTMIGLMGTLMGTLWERVQCAYARLLIFQDEMARPERFELPTPRFVVWGRPLMSLRFVPIAA
jgi:hypothetical protein